PRNFMRPTSLEDQSAQKDHCPLARPTSLYPIPLCPTFVHSIGRFGNKSSKIHRNCAKFVEFEAAEKLLLALPHPVCPCRIPSLLLVARFLPRSFRPFSLP